MKLAVGFFDGVHLGHKSILRNADHALTFRNHPATLLAPESAPGLLMSADERIGAIARELRGGAADTAQVTALEFTRELSSLQPERFAEWLAARFPGLEEIHCGANWRFGAGGRGDAQLLERMGIKTVVAPWAEYEGAPVSSTRIRQALLAGRVDEANAMLGRMHTVRGAVERGKGEGAKMGVPTINLRFPAGMAELKRGVYAVRTQWGAAVANYGLAPTMGARAWPHPRFEVHLIDGAVGSAVANAEVTVELAAWLREERAFASTRELVGQIRKDIEACKRILI